MQNANSGWFGGDPIGDRDKFLTANHSGSIGGPKTFGQTREFANIMATAASPGPAKNNFWDFLKGLFGGDKGAGITTLASGAEISRVSRIVQIGEIIEINAQAFYSAVGTLATRSLWGLPLMLNGDTQFAANSKGVDIPATDVDSKPKGNITLYRGVSLNGGIAYEEALLGIATPNGFRLSFTGAFHSNMGLHAGGDNNSIWTSWTPMKDVATKFALGRNNVGGVLLTKTFTLGQAIPNTSFMAKEYYADEYEFLVPGIVVGASVTPIKPK